MSQNLLTKISEESFLSNMFDFINKKRAVKLIFVNKKLSNQLKLTIDDYLLEEKYRKIILRSKGYINDISHKIFRCYQDLENSGLTYLEFIKKVLKYLKYLLDRKVFKCYIISFDYFSFLRYSHVSFIVEAIRFLKTGISFKTYGPLNFKYYEILKDAIINLEEVHSITNYLISQSTVYKISSFKLYYELFDWTKIKCIDFVDSPKRSVGHFELKNVLIIPDNANFRKIIIDDSNYINCNLLAPIMIKHGEHIESLKVFNFNDNKVNTDFYQNLNNIKKVKFINCEHFLFYKFLFFFKKNLSGIKVLYLDNILESDSKAASDKKTDFYVIENVLPRLTNLEKLYLNFKQAHVNIYKLLTLIISYNPNLKEIKICLNSRDKPTPKNKSSAFLENFLVKGDDLEGDDLKEFYELIKVISSLKNLSVLELNFELSDKMTQIVNTFLNLGENLKSLSIIHTKKLNVTQLFNSHPNLVRINLCLNETDNEDTKLKFNYEFSQRSWKSIMLKNYPLNNSFVDAIVKAKNSIYDLTLENTFNVCQLSDSELNNILLALKNNMI